ISLRCLQRNGSVRVMGRKPIGKTAMSSTERSQRFRARQQAAKPPRNEMGGGDFALFARAALLILAELGKALHMPGRKEELQNAAVWQFSLLCTLIREWSNAPAAERERLGNARNVSQMFAFGECDATRAAYGKDMLSEIAKNPNWPNPPRKTDIRIRDLE